MPYKKSYRKKRVPLRRKRNYKKKGLSNLEKKQVSTIINKKSETKYMQSVYNLQGQSLKFQSSAATENEIMVRAFAIGTGEIGGLAAHYGYESIGGSPRAITPIHGSRTFDSTVVTGTDYFGNVPEGKYVNPSMSRCEWRIHRGIIDTSDTEKMRIASPYYVRMVRVVPRNSKFSDTTYVPSNDLFLNQYSIDYGIDSPANDHQKNFGLFEMLTAKVNSRKYIVIQDTTFQLNCPNINTQLSTDLICSQTSGSHQRMLTTNHKMPKKLFYSGTYDTADTRQPLAGQSAELIFFHVGTVGTTTKDLELDCKIDLKPVFTFKDP